MSMSNYLWGLILVFLMGLVFLLGMSSGVRAQQTGSGQTNPARQTDQTIQERQEQTIQDRDGQPDEQADPCDGIDKPDETNLVYLSDITPFAHMNGWGLYETDLANGEIPQRDGGPIRLDDCVFQKGLGIAATSELTYALNKSCTEFRATIGLDDVRRDYGATVIFEVIADGQLLYSSPLFNANTPRKDLLIDVTNRHELVLRVWEWTDGNANDGADWANARVICTNPFAHSTVNVGQSIQTAANSLSAGQTLLVNSGLHRNQTFEPKANTTITGKLGTVILGSRAATTWTYCAAGANCPDSANRCGINCWYTDGQSYPITIDTVQQCNPNYPRCGYRITVVHAGIPLRHAASLNSQNNSGRFYASCSGSPCIARRIYMFNDPKWSSVEISTMGSGLGSYSQTGWTAQKLTFLGHTVRGVEMYHNTTLQDSAVKHVHHWGIHASAWNLMIRRNRICHNGGYNLNGGGNNIQVRDNEICWTNHHVGYEDYWGASTKFVHTDGLIYDGNFIHHNKGPGIWTDINNINCTYSNNTVEDNRVGIFQELGFACRIENNEVSRNGVGYPALYPGAADNACIMVVDSPNVIVTGNTCTDNQNGIIAMDDGRTCAISDNCGAHGQTRTNNFNAMHNTVIQSGSLFKCTNGICFSGLIGPVTNSHFEGNDYTLTGVSDGWAFQEGGKFRTDAYWRLVLGHDDLAGGGSIKR